MSLVGNIFRFLFPGILSKKTVVQMQTATQIQEKWNGSVKLALKTRQPSQLRQALITTDKLLDAALKDVASGENMGQRLKNAQNLFEWKIYDKLWKAHKVRNSLVHELSYEPTYFVLEEAIQDLKVGLEILGVNL